MPPAALALGVPADFVTVIAGPDGMVVSVESDAVTVAPEGGDAVAVAVFATWPESTSVCVIV